MKKRVMVIDDDSQMLNLYKTILEMNDYDVIVASSGQTALSLLATIKEPDLILLDVIMPEMSGPEFLVELEEQLPQISENVSIVFSSALEKVPRSKASGFIRKPTDLHEFLDDVRCFIEKSEMLKQKEK